MPGTGTISGTVTDTSGAPLAGAMVVAGDNSPTAITDMDGKFTLSDVPAGKVTVNTVTPGYQTNDFSVNVIDRKTTTLPAPIELADEDDIDDAPQITNVNVSATGTTISVTATIQPGASDEAISDARAELVGYGTGSKMTANGSTYSASIEVPGDFVGPIALVDVFAVDAKGRVGVSAASISIPGASGSGGFTETTFDGSWAGNAVYHRAPFGDRDRIGDKRVANVGLSNSGASVSGSYADLMIEKFLPASSWAVTTTSFTGNLTLIDARLGIYVITSTFNPTGTRTVSLTLIGKLDSADAPSNFFGYFKAVITDTSPQNVTTVFGRVHLVKDLTWSTSDLDGNWVWSEFVKDCQTICGTTFTYMNPFQYNSAFISASGTISNGVDTMGHTLTTATALSVIDSSLGTFTGTFTGSDGSTVTFSGLIGPKKKHVIGLFNVAASGKTAYGSFWGNSIAAPPHFDTADFGRKRFDASIGTAIWRGYYYVTGTGGPDPAGTICYLSLWTKSDGSVVGGVIKPILLSSCPLTTFSSGSLSFVDATDGQISGSAAGGGTTFTLGPASSRNASMGVEKARLVGDISASVPGGTDTGFFFLQRTLIE
ncbi:MAG TPA: carboxypeptidase regulatory-like domain-containing protein [Nitrospiria bacterium]|nr:carboxypeptidase regulatory-like domain-containing protein [Nitrospiria bacterium]